MAPPGASATEPTISPVTVTCVIGARGWARRASSGRIATSAVSRTTATARLPSPVRSTSVTGPDSVIVDAHAGREIDDPDRGASLAADDGEARRSG